jgi:hypothetical protein
VVALTALTAAIQCPGGHTVTYRKLNKPALGPVGDSLDDFSGGFNNDALRRIQLLR